MGCRVRRRIGMAGVLIRVTSRDDEGDQDVDVSLGGLTVGGCVMRRGYAFACPD